MTQRKNIDIGPVIAMTRSAYRMVKIAPFVYAMIYVSGLFCYLFFNDTVSAIIDVLCYISPVPVIYNLMLSRAFHLCVWHRTECCLPLVAVFVVGVDSFTAFQRRLQELLRLRLSESAVGEALSFSIGAIWSLSVLR